MNFHRIDEHNMQEHGDSRISLRDLSNQIIHSLFFGFESKEETGPISGFLVVSDRNKHKQIFGIDIADYLSAIRLVGNDCPTKYIAMRTDEGWNVSVS